MVTLELTSKMLGATVLNMVNEDRTCAARLTLGNVKMDEIKWWKDRGKNLA